MIKIMFLNKILKYNNEIKIHNIIEQETEIDIKLIKNKEIDKIYNLYENKCYYYNHKHNECLYSWKYKNNIIECWGFTKDLNINTKLYEEDRNYYIESYFKLFNKKIYDPVFFIMKSPLNEYLSFNHSDLLLFINYYNMKNKKNKKLNLINKNIKTINKKLKYIKQNIKKNNLYLNKLKDIREDDEDNFKLYIDNLY